jgi:hypothetical protein
MRPHLTLLATGSLERGLLVFSTPGGLTGETFHTCSSPALTPVKPQPAPAILSQESVQTTLSITHHTRKRPPTGPQTTHGPQWPAVVSASLDSRSGEMIIVPNPQSCSTFIHVADDPRSWVIHYKESDTRGPKRGRM